MNNWYPLRFRPILKNYLWGGRRLATKLGKPVPADSICAESWEICDHGSDQSIVAEGPLAGVTLGELVAEHGQGLLGEHYPQPRFPLLFKFLDARRQLSVQVHPDDQLAARLDPPDFGKTEAWYVLEAEPESRIYAGLKRGFDREALSRELTRGTCELCLHSFQGRAGESVFVPAGLVHALGAGLLIAEIQQSSDVTYRLFDWNRLGPDNQPRQLHIQEGLEAIDFSRGPASPQLPQPTDHPARERLVACDKFVLDRLLIDQPAKCGGAGGFHILAVVDGQVELIWPGGKYSLRRGDTVLLPAALGEVSLAAGQGRGVVLDAYLPSAAGR